MQLTASRDIRASVPTARRVPGPFWWERLYVVLTLIYASDAFTGVFTPVEFDASASRNAGDIVLEACVYAIAVALVLWHWRTVLKALGGCKWAIILLALALISALWSPEPALAFRQAVWLGGTTMFGMYLGTRFSREEQISAMNWALGAVALLSLFLALFAPAYGVEQEGHFGAWRGVFNDKNMFGRAMVLGLVVAICSPRKRLIGSLARIGGFYVLVLLSGSATAAAAGALLLLVSFIYRVPRLSVMARLSMAMIILAAVTAYLGFFYDHGSVLDLLGRDDTLTGRLPLWDEVGGAIGAKPIFGYGFASFWRGTVGPSAKIIDTIGWVTPYAHNGFLDLWLELGLLGVVIFGIGFVERFKSAFTEYRRIGSPAALWPLLFLSFLVVYNVTEGTLLAQHSLYWALYVSVLASRARTLLFASPSHGDKFSLEKAALIPHEHWPPLIQNLNAQVR